MDNVKQILVNKILENIEQLEADEQCNAVGLELYEVVEAVITSELNRLNIEQLAEML